LKIPLTPVPASRPRVTRWGTYYGKRYTQWRASAEELLSEAEFTFEIPVSVSVLFAIPRSKTGKLETPVGDGDNYEKAIYDLLQMKQYLSDDRLITSATWKKRFLCYGEKGYTEIKIWKETEEIEI